MLNIAFDSSQKFLSQQGDVFDEETNGNLLLLAICVFKAELILKELKAILSCYL